MFLKRYFVEGLAHASHLFGSGGEAAVVDPRRDVDEYLADAAAAGLRIVAVLNSHPHADFASGFLELAQRSGARIYCSHRAPVTYEHVAAREGDRVRVGDLEVEIWETPGHSPDSLSFLVRPPGEKGRLFTGDLLFVGDVGRPDLRDAEADPSELARQLHHSLYDKVLGLPDDVVVHPSHGAGSLCGRSLGSAPETRVGEERAQNWALQFPNEAAFTRAMLENLPERPAYFAYGVGLNLAGSPPLSSLAPPRELSEAEAGAAVARGAVAVDVRSVGDFGAGHLPGSLHVGIESKMFATWTGFLVPPGSEIVLVVDSAAQAGKAQLELARIGFDRVGGYTLADELTALEQISQLSVAEVRARRAADPEFGLLDVRNAAEQAAGPLDGATHIPLPQLSRRLGELPRGRPLAVACASGFRSSIAASLLQRAGFSSVANLQGGCQAWRAVRER